MDDRDYSNTLLAKKGQSCSEKLKKYANNLGKIFPKSKMKLPLHYKGSQYFTSRRVTLLSFMIISFILLNSYLSIIKIGQINTLLSQEVNF